MIPQYLIDSLISSITSYQGIMTFHLNSLSIPFTIKAGTKIEVRIGTNEYSYIVDKDQELKDQYSIPCTLTGRLFFSIRFAGEKAEFFRDIT